MAFGVIPIRWNNVVRTSTVSSDVAISGVFLKENDHANLSKQKRKVHDWSMTMQLFINNSMICVIQECFASEALRSSCTAVVVAVNYL